MRLSRRLLLAGGAAFGVAAGGRAQAAAARRDMVILHTDDATGHAFAAAARCPAFGRVTALPLAAAADNHAAIKAAVAAGRGTRLLACLTARDDAVLTTLLRRAGAVYPRAGEATAQHGHLHGGRWHISLADL